MFGKILSVFLCVLLTFGACAAAESAAPAQGDVLFGDNTVFSPATAAFALTIASPQTADSVAQTLGSLGFDVLCQTYYDKAADDTSHTSAYTVAAGTMPVGGEDRTVLVLTIRGTSGAEWYSNFDVAPSHSDTTQFAENFLLAANEPFEALRREAAAYERPVVLICGFSRGAACANLAGVLWDTLAGPEDLYVYTFATPATVRSDYSDAPFDNIFNLINPGDLIPLLPPEAWGFRRAGTDVILPGESLDAGVMQGIVDVMTGLASGIADYYEVRHSLTGPGLAEDGMTLYEAMQTMISGLYDPNAAQDAASGQAMAALAGGQNDFMPLLMQMAQLFRDRETMGRVAQQHMPQQYAQLLGQMTQGGE